jgi:regulator of CtrA degradation
MNASQPLNNSTQSIQPSELARKLLESDDFSTLYGSVMALVNDSASYLDNEGRAAAKLMSRHQSAVYAQHSFALTTSCMRTASSALMLRAALKREQSLDYSISEVMRTDVLHKATTTIEQRDQMPEGLVRLMTRAEELSWKMRNLANSLVASEEKAVNAVHSALANLQLAFGARYN